MHDLLRLCASALVLLAIHLPSIQGQGVTCTGVICPTGSACQIVTDLGGVRAVCVAVCPALNIPNGSPSSTVVTQGTQVTITCNQGFTLVGQAVITCINSVWSPAVPVCQAAGVTCVGVICPPGSSCEVVNVGGFQFTRCRSLTRCPVLSIPNGSPSSTATTVDTTVTITCNPGFTLVGASVITCFSNGVWSPTPPTCRANACPVLTISNGFPSTTQVTEGTVTTISCNTGFTLIGQGTITCSNGAWLPTVPFCQASTCPVLNINNGRPSSPVVTAGTQVNIICNPGYNILGQATITCLNGVWRPTVPTCQLASCPILNIQNAQLSTTSTTVGTRVIVQCNSGFVFVGQNRELLCEANGNWSPSIPQCRRIECVPLQAPQNGRIVSGQNAVSIGSRTIFGCNSGFLLQGSDTRTCQNNGIWSGSQPVCIQLCAVPSTPPNGEVTPQGDGSPGTFILYRCNPGFALQGPDRGVCQNGVYNPPPPPCAPAFCTVPSLQNGQTNITSSRVSIGQWVGFSCAPGYRLEGSPAVRCLDTTGFDRPPPVCIAVPQCPLITPQPFRQDSYQNNRLVGSAVTFTCASGYVLQGASSLQCQGNLQWNAPAPVCTTNVCPAVPQIQNGRPTTADNRLNSRVSYVCNSGFVLTDNTPLTCRQVPGQSPQWDRPPPQCVQANTCPAVPQVQNGRASTSDNRLNSQVSYVCDSGFTLTDSTPLVCRQAPGQPPRWDRPAPQCIRANACPQVPTIQNGRPSTTDNRINSRVDYVCNSGFVLSDSTPLICRQAPGQAPQWDRPPPQCNRAVLCPPVPQIQNGRPNTNDNRLNSRVSYSCNNGFRLTDNTPLTCRQLSGQAPQWDRPAPQCIVAGCSNPPNITNGFVNRPFSTNLGSRVTYSCNNGFQLSQNIPIVCTPGGQNQPSRWSPSPPQCIVGDCGPLPNLANAAEWAPNLPITIGSTHTVSCNMGFNPQVITATCSQAGRWVYSSGCTAIRCPPVSPPRFGRVTTTNNLLGSTVNVSCNAGYQITGPNILTCRLTDRGYQFSPSVPQCIEVMCMSLMAPQNGQVNVPSNRPTSVARYTCNPGYNLRGSETRVCGSNGRWSGNDPICAPVDCGNQLPNFANAISRLPAGATDTTFRRTYPIPCQSGYMPETIQVTCSQSATWETVQSCVALPQCPSIRQPNQAGMTVNGFTITFTCGPGFRLEGPTTITCSNGRWNSPPPICRAISGCPTLNNPANGRIVSRRGNNEPGTTVQFACSNGFQLNPPTSSVLTCLQNRQWDRPVPTCTPIPQCADFNNPANGFVTHGQQSGIRVATFRCNPGFQLAGPGMLSCINGQWNGAAPTCVPSVPQPQVCDNTCSQNPGPAPCGPLNPIPLGCRCYACNNVQCEATYRCVTGYVLRNDPGRRICQNGVWTGNAPTCQRIGGPGSAPCRLTQPIDYGSSQIVDGVLRFRCGPGFVLSGPDRIVCDINGLIPANTVLPTCSRVGQVRCSPLNIQFGTFTSSGDTPGSNGVVTCNPGYGMNNPSDANVVCLQNGQWGGNPVCRPIGVCSQLNINGVTVSYSTGQFRGVNGTIATFTCPSGQQLNGPSESICINTVWQPEPPTGCTSGPPPPSGNICPPIPFPEGLNYTLNGQLGSVATFTCNQPNTQAIPSSSTCIRNGTWSPTPPTRCVARGNNCQVFSVIGGNVAYNPAPSGNQVVSGTVADTRCPSSSTPDTNQARTTCQNGVWNPTPPTRCVRGPTGPSCPQISIANGVVEYSNGLNTGSLARFICSGVRLSQISTCINGQWSPPPPNSCPTGQVTCPNVNANYTGAVVYETPSRPQGSRVQITCQGSSPVIGTCLSTGQWGNFRPNAPSCPSGQVNCRDISTDFGGAAVVYETPSRPQGSRVQITCPGSTAVIGTCLSSGQWGNFSPNAPTCASTRP